MTDELDFRDPSAAVAAGDRVDVASLSEAGLGVLMRELGEKAFRAKQLFSWLHGKRVTSFDEMTNLSAALRKRLHDRGMIARPVVDDVKVAADGTRKYQLLTHDGHVIEAVWIPHASAPGRHALCISSQVGCAMGCRFCATASLKLTRHLMPGEIAGQVYAVAADLEQHLPEDPPLPSSKMKHRYDHDVSADDGVDDDIGGDDDDDDTAAPRRGRRIHTLVYMGMGEPLHNIDGVIGSVGLLTHGQGMGYSPRRITVSTSGVVQALPRLGSETGVHLAISLNATTDEGRGRIMPVNKRWDMGELLAAVDAFPSDRRRHVTFEYVLLKDENDSDDDARRLAKIMKGRRAKVNLIPFNPHPLSPYGRPDDDRVDAFRAILDAARVESFVRTTRGLDIDAACGMLGAKKLEAARGALAIVE
jgi:23S rRNA (adenine2503-C2)-methyltransferase